MKSRFVLVIAAAVLVAACYSQAQYEAMLEEASIDIGEEQDILFACAVQVAESVGEVDRQSELLRRVVTGWQPDGSQRTRVSVSVIYDEAYGPGMTVARIREGWTGADEAIDYALPTLPDASDTSVPGWVRVESTDEDRALEQALAGEIETCWLDERDSSSP